MPLRPLVDFMFTLCLHRGPGGQTAIGSGWVPLVKPVRSPSALGPSRRLPGAITTQKPPTTPRHPAEAGIQLRAKGVSFQNSHENLTRKADRATIMDKCGLRGEETPLGTGQE